MTPWLKQLIMPPFVAIEIPACGGHQAEQYSTVALGIGADIQPAVMRERREGIKARAHIEFGAAGVHQGKVNRGTTRMRRATARIGQEIRIGIVIPQGPLRFRWAEGIKNLEAVAQRRRERDGACQQLGSFVIQIGGARA